VDVLARCLVGEHAIHRYAFQLAIRVLVETADPDVPDSLTVHAISRLMCQEKSMTFMPMCQQIRK
jgi:hypothetical protein